MQMEVTPGGEVIITRVFNPICLITPSGDALHITMRDGGIEIKYAGKLIKLEHGIARELSGAAGRLAALPPMYIEPLNKQLYGAIFEGLIFRGKHFMGIVTVRKIKDKENTLVAEIDPEEKGVSPWQEDWNLEHTVFGFENGEYWPDPANRHGVDQFAAKKENISSNWPKAATGVGDPVDQKACLPENLTHRNINAGQVCNEGGIEFIPTPEKTKGDSL